MNADDPLLDRAVTRIADDKIGRSPFVESLCRALVRDTRDTEGKLIRRTSTGYVVGLTGPWGAGKSSVLHFVYEKLSSESKVIVAMFNPWIFKGRDELFNGYFLALKGATGLNLSEQSKDIISSLERYWETIGFVGQSIATAADMAGGGGAATSAWKFGRKAAKDFNKPRTLDEERKSLEKKIATSGSAFVVLIDELDRVEDDEVRAIAQLIKAVGDIKGISYLVAYDPPRVIDALGRGEDDDTRRRTGEAYLEKIIQHTIPIRPLLPQDIEQLFEQATTSSDLTLSAPATEHQTKQLDAVKSCVRTPRDIKRLLGSYAVIEAAVRGEVSQYDILCYAWILAKSPTLRDQIAEKKGQLVEDPPTDALYERMLRQASSAPKPSDYFGNIQDGLSQILTLMFPVFGVLRSADSLDGKRISRYQNLMRILYLGNPPNVVTRSQVMEAVHASTPAAIGKILEEIKISNGFAELLLRINDFLSEVPDTNDFWLALSDYDAKGSDWISSQSDAENKSETLATMLLNWAEQSPSQRTNIQKILARLIEKQDLEIVPYIIRRHLFRYGLTDIKVSESDLPLIYTKEELAAIWNSEAARYRVALQSGEFLKKARNFEAIYSLLNSGLWEPSDRDALTEHAAQHKGLITLAALLVPPGIMISRDALALLIDVEKVSPALDALLPNSSEEHDPWIQKCLVRLQRTIAGHDPYKIDVD